MLDFVSLAGDKGIPVIESGHKKCSEGWIQTHCPFCSGGNDGWHLGFSEEGGNFNCWKCGSHPLFETIKRLMRTNSMGTVKQAIDKHSGAGHRVVKKQKKVRSRNARKPFVAGVWKAAHYSYMAKRNFNLDALVEEWGLIPTNSSGKKWRWRIVAPILDQNKKIVGYTGRSVVDASGVSKWMTSSDSDFTVNPKSVLYGMGNIPGDSVLIVEGPGDVWRMGPGAVATMGTAWNVEQAGFIRTFKRRFIMFDNEPTAQKKAKELAMWLAPFEGTTEIITGIDTDPGDLSQAEADNIIKELNIRSM